MLPKIGQRIIAQHRAGNERVGIVENVYPEVPWRGTPPMVFYRDHLRYRFILRLGQGDSWEKYPRPPKQPELWCNPNEAYCIGSTRHRLIRENIPEGWFCTRAINKKGCGKPATWWPGTDDNIVHCVSGLCDACAEELMR